MSESLLPFESSLPGAVPTRRREQMARALIWRALESLEVGAIEVRDGEGLRRFGQRADEAPLSARVMVRDPRFYTDVLRRGILGSGESWMEGRWSCDDLPSLVRMLLRNRRAMENLGGPLGRALIAARNGIASLRRNTPRLSRRQIRAHYDLGNDFFSLFLDPTLTYSAGIFAGPETSMEQASLAKIDRLCGMIDLSPEDHLLEIGSGWGALAVRAARERGCRVTTITLSREQEKMVRRRIAEAGLEDRVEVRLVDYRLLPGRFDKLVSVEMIEAVGHKDFPTYFRRCGELLRPGGEMALQAIVIDDDHYESAKTNEDFIKRHIFPGGCLPSRSVIRGQARAAGLVVERMDELTPHYAETLRRWRSRFHENRRSIRALGLNERFLRMWDFYLAYCEGGFEERHIGLVQVRLCKPERPEPAC